MQKIKEILKKHKTKVTHVQLYRFMLNPNHMGGGQLEPCKSSEKCLFSQHNITAYIKTNLTYPC